MPWEEASFDNAMVLDDLIQLLETKKHIWQQINKMFFEYNYQLWIGANSIKWFFEKLFSFVGELLYEIIRLFFCKFIRIR